MRKILRGAVVLLIAVAMVFSTVAVTADTVQETNELEMDSSCIKSTNTNPSEPIIEPALGPVIFQQLPSTPDDPWIAYTSATNLNYLCMDNFWDLTQEICDIHWWGLSLFWAPGWVPCDPTGMQFEIIFYDANLNPVCVYSPVMPTPVYTGVFYGDWELLYWETDLDPCCSLINGWVSIQSIYSPNDCSFLWMNSLIGDLNAMQNGASLNDNLAFEITAKKSRDINTPILDFLQNHPNMFPLLQILLQRLGVF